MKHKIQSLLLLIILISLNLNACKDSPGTPKKSISKPTSSKIEEPKNEDNIEPPIEKKSVAPIKINSRLRPNEKIELGKVYKDTVTYLELNDDSDYWYFLAKKNKDTVYIFYHADESIGELIKEDQIEVNWKMIKMENPGDPELSIVKPFLVSFNKIISANLTDKKVKVLWREDQFDKELKMEINTITLNEDYLKNIHELEKAALAYVATFIGNECEWDGKVNENRSNLKCKLIIGLGLGYQCSPEHLSFLNKRFTNDTKALEKLKKCPTTPNTATIQSTFNEIELVTNSQNQTILINYKATKINVREGSSSSYIKTGEFKYNLDQTTLIHTEKAGNNAAVTN